MSKRRPIQRQFLTAHGRLLLSLALIILPTLGWGKPQQKAEETQGMGSASYFLSPSSVRTYGSSQGFKVQGSFVKAFAPLALALWCLGLAYLYGSSFTFQSSLILLGRLQLEGG